MVKRMSSRDARANFAELLGSVYYTREPVIVERKGKPYAVLISPEQWEQIRQDQIDRGWAAVDAIQERNREVDPDDAYQDVTAIVEQVRQERHGRE
jgi:prevent-host-death family protein